MLTQRLQGNGGAIFNFAGGSPTIINCSFYGNTALGVGGTMFSTNAANFSSTETILNSVLWGNTLPEVVDEIAAVTTIMHSNIQGGWSGAGSNNINADPQFADQANGDLRLLIKSPSIDAADNTAVPVGMTTDLAGNPRFVDTALAPDTGNGTPPIVDMGAFEHQGEPIFIPTVSAWGLVVMAVTMVCAATLFIRQRRRYSRPLCFSYVHVSVAISFVLSSSTLAQTTWQVDDDNCPAPGAGTSGDPFCSIQVGIDASADGDDVLVSPGTYNETINFNGKAITLHSTEGPEVTIIDATGLNDTAVRCVSGEGPDTILQGMTITKGVGFANGGGIFIAGSSPTIDHCIIRDNTIIPVGPLNCGGGGIYVEEGSPTISACQFINNFLPNGGQCGGSGGAIKVVGGGPLIVNSSFFANSAFRSGGGIRNDVQSSSTIVNCTFVANIARSFLGGGISNRSDSNVLIYNSIVWNNTDGFGPSPDEQIHGPATVSYSNIDGGWSGAGSNNINADPQFADQANGDLRLLIKSPSIDAADNTAVPVGMTTDLAGNPRFVDTALAPDTGNGTPPIVDMGAFEHQGEPIFIPTVSAWGLVTLALAILCVGAVFIRKRAFVHAGLFEAFVALTLLGGITDSVVQAQVHVDPQQIRIDVAEESDASVETSIAANFDNGEIVATWISILQTGPGETSPLIERVGVGLSLDGGGTWVDFVLRPPPGFTALIEFDPMTAYDDRTGTFWAGGIAGPDSNGMLNLFVARKDPGENAFEQSVVVDSEFGFFAIDKGWMAAGPAFVNPNATRLYVAYNLGVARSADLGDSWSGPVPLGPIRFT